MEKEEETTTDRQTNFARRLDLRGGRKIKEHIKYEATPLLNLGTWIFLRKNRSKQSNLPSKKERKPTGIRLSLP